MELESTKKDGFIERDYKFENWILWEVEYSKGDYNIYTKDLIEKNKTVQRKLKESPKKLSVTKTPSAPLTKKPQVTPKPPVTKVSPIKKESPATKTSPASATQKPPVSATPKPSVPPTKKPSLTTTPSTTSTVKASPAIKTPPASSIKKSSVAKKPTTIKKPPISTNSIKFPTQRVKQVYFLSARQKLNISKASGEKIIEDKNSVLRSLFINDEQEEIRLFPDKNPLRRNAEKDLEDREHQKLLKEQEKSYKQDQRNVHTYNLKDFPLAEPELINKLSEIHSKYFRLLSKLQDTHTPEDFVTAFRIQDRIAYLLDNQTLLYKTLTKKLIKYLERINEKLKKYLEDIALKQEDLKRMNAQISRFNEYDRKTQSRLDQAETETNLFQKDLQTYQDSLRELQSELQTTSISNSPDDVESQEIKLDLNNDVIVH